MTKVFLSATLSFGILLPAHAEKQPASLSEKPMISLEKSQGSGHQQPRPVADNKFGVGLTGSDEKLLNSLDNSSLMDYQDTAPQQAIKRDQYQPASGNSSQDKTPNNKQGLRKDSELLLIKSLEETLVEDLKN